MSDGYDALTDREKQTLRLILRGHDAKSIARHFDLSVHTINERLRDARRKLAVSSSREAARLLLAHEDGTPQSLGDERMGEDAERTPPDDTAPQPEPGPARRRAPLIIGAAVMSIALALLAITTAPSPTALAPTLTQAQASEAATAARDWLALVDAGRWNDSWQATGSSFRALNTAAVWASVSEKVRTPLGAMRSRTFVSQEEIPAPPAGYMLVKFRTDFANKAGALETLTLAQEGGKWRVTGIWVE